MVNSNNNHVGDYESDRFVGHLLAVGIFASLLMAMC
jgi:hypothetical protein